MITARTEARPLMNLKVIHKVMLVDPDEGARNALRGHLEHHGYLVECADDAPDAIRRGLKFEPHVLVTEVELAQQTFGIDVARSLTHHVADLAVIVHTDEDHGELHDRNADYARARFASKSTSLDALREMIEQRFTAQIPDTPETGE